MSLAYSTKPYRYDVVIIGAGMGGSALAYSLRNSGLRIAVVEKGERFRQERENWNPVEVIGKARYSPEETWLTNDGKPFHPRVYYTTGGSSKFFGAVAFRLRESDFQEITYPGGSSPPWPITYETLEPYYTEAEMLMGVHGVLGDDPSEPPRPEYPFPPIEDEPPIGWLRERLSQCGVTPFHLPVAVDQGEGGRCRKGSVCDGFPCMVRAKGDGENAFLLSALKSPNVELITDLSIDTLTLAPKGNRIEKAEGGRRDGDGETRISLEADTFVLAAGAVNSAAILLRSRSSKAKQGVANSSGCVGRYFMCHNASVIIALSPIRHNPTIFQKTLGFHDFYSTRDGAGSVQMRGKLLPEHLLGDHPFWMKSLRGYITSRSFDFWAMSEDLPSWENRVELSNTGEIQLFRYPNNADNHRAFMKRVVKVIRKAGFPIVLARPTSIGAIQHQCGTIRMGSSPDEAPLDPVCRSHDHENLWVCDSSVFPSSGAVNPALTVAANALRVGNEILQRRK